jgi:hypothetical protein
MGGSRTGCGSPIRTRTRGRHRVATAASPRMTASETAEGQPTAAQRTVALQGLDRVLRAGGHEPTARRRAEQRHLERRHDPAVPVHHDQEEGAHGMEVASAAGGVAGRRAAGSTRVESGSLHNPASRRQRSRSRSTIAWARPAMEARATRTSAMGRISRCWFNRKAVRSSRRARLRITAPPIRRLAITPSRLRSPSGKGRQLATRQPHTRRCPVSRVCTNSRDPRSRWSRPRRNRSREPGGAVGTGQTAVSRARPLERRRRITVRPPRVAMRARNPSWRLRRIFDGWYWRFMS